jgi:hypothetical protein
MRHRKSSERTGNPGRIAVMTFGSTLSFLRRSDADVLLHFSDDRTCRRAQGADHKGLQTRSNIANKIEISFEKNGKRSATAGAPGCARRHGPLPGRGDHQVGHIPVVLDLAQRHYMGRGV